MRDCNPQQVLLAISRIKYRKALIPLIIVIGAFFIQMSSGNPNLRYLSLLGLIYYLFLLLIFRVNRYPVEPDDTTVLSPVNGKVIKIESDESGEIIFINKNFLQAADIRFSTGDERPDHIVVTETNTETVKRNELSFTDNKNLTGWTLKGNSIFFFPGTPVQQGVLTGIIPGNALCVYRLTPKITLRVKTSDKVEAGITVLGSM